MKVSSLSVASIAASVILLNILETFSSSSSSSSSSLSSSSGNSNNNNNINSNSNSNSNSNNNNHKRRRVFSDSYRQPCTTDDDCPLQLTCQFGYHGCRTGRCDCQRPREKFVAGRCLRAKLGNSDCGDSDECPAEMTCDHVTRKCTCPAKRSMTSDGLHCLSDAERTLGESCDPDVDTCFQRVGDTYTSINVHCSREGGVCSCDAVAKDGFSCRSYRVDEWGCEQIYDCEGGAICRGSRCRCPPTFKRWGNRCVRSNATLDVGVGGTCDEMNEISYCSQGLVCAHCPPSPLDDDDGGGGDDGSDDDDDDDDDDVTWRRKGGNQGRSSSSSSMQLLSRRRKKLQKVCLKPLMTGIHLHSTSVRIEPLSAILFLACRVLHLWAS